MEHGNGHEKLALSHNGAYEHLQFAAGHVVHFKLNRFFRHVMLKGLYAFLKIRRRNDFHRLEPLGMGGPGKRRTSVAFTLRMQPS